MSRFIRLVFVIGAAVAASPLYAQPVVYATDPPTNSLIAINSGSNTIIRALTGLSGARSVAVSADGTRVYVAEASSGKVAVLDATKISNPNQSPLIDEIAVGGKPIALDLDTSSDLLYVADASNNKAASYNLASVEASSPKPVATYTAGSGLAAMALAPDGKTLALASTSPPSVVIYNLRMIAAGQSGKSVISLGSKPQALAFSPRGDTLWIATDAGFSYWSAATGAVGSMTISGGTTSVAFAPRASLVYFGAGSGNAVYTYFPGSNTTGSIATSGPVSGLALSADGTRLYATQKCSDCGLSVISTSQGQALTQIHFGNGPVTAGQFAGPGAIYAPDSLTAGTVEQQLSGSVSASDRDGRSLGYSVISPPDGGSLDFNSTGDFTYTPPSGYSGVQTFVWQASASSGEGSPVNPASRPITETFEIHPTLSTIADQNANTGDTLGPLAFTIDGSKPFTIDFSSSNGGVVKAGDITVSSGCGTSSLSCTLTIPVGNTNNATARITMKATDASGLQTSTSFKVIVGNGSGSSGGFTFAGLALLAFLASFAALIHRRIA